MNKELLGAVLLGVAIFTFRFIPNPDNFTPLLALTLGVGFLGRGNWYVFLIPVVAMLAADLNFGLYPGWAFTYIPLVAIAYLGTTSQPKFTRMAGLAFSASALFFIVSNFGVWMSSGMYPKTMEGLWTCYLAAVPFFHKTLAGTLVYTGLLFTTLYWALNYSRKRVMGQ